MKKYILDSKNYYVTPSGDVVGYRGRFLTQHCNGRGYKHVVIVNNDNTKKTRTVHRLVAEAYIPNPENKPEVNHIDGNKLNNHVDNLEWVTSSENSQHAVDMGLQKIRCGEEINFTTNTTSTIHKICHLLESGYRNVDICNKLNVSRSVVDQVRSGLNWKHISCQYNFKSVSRRRAVSESTAKWVCHMLESGFKPLEILSKSTSKSLSYGVIKSIKNHSAYKDISENFSF